ncbi:MAG: hypothetical protein V3U92_12720 [Cellulophaga sp.]
MKHIFISLLSFFFIAQTSSAQETKIPFSKGILKICSSKNFKISGYNGKEVIIKSLHKKNISSRNFVLEFEKARTRDSMNTKNLFGFIRSNNASRKKGLKKLGKNSPQENGIYFDIIEKEGELLLQDKTGKDWFVMVSDESYEIKVPNTVSLNWNTSKCSKNKNVFYNSKTSSLSNFSEEVTITSTLNNLLLQDVSGPVSINSIGGNVTVEFDKKTPSQLYSIYTNNGFIDITLPSTSNLIVDAKGNSIFSNLDFNILSEEENSGVQEMKLQLKSGKVKMKLNASLGDIYLRKK